jgi:hypothetical protein
VSQIVSGAWRGIQKLLWIIIGHFPLAKESEKYQNSRLEKRAGNPSGIPPKIPPKNQPLSTTIQTKNHPNFFSISKRFFPNDSGFSGFCFNF